MMGLTAEMLGRMHGITREKQDKFAARSHAKAWEATQKGRFKKEIVGIEGSRRKRRARALRHRRGHPSGNHGGGARRIATGVRPARRHRDRGHLVGDLGRRRGDARHGDERAKSLGLEAARTHRFDGGRRLRSCDHGLRSGAGHEEGAGSAPSMDMNDVQVAELNEAFAAQSLPVLKDLGLLDEYDQKVNLNGGAIALGHPLGCSGARITTTLLGTMEQSDAEFGLATMCIGLGQGISTIVQRV